MKIKRYFAPDIRGAIRGVREELGPDAVILSNRRVEGGVEIVAAMDYDEALVQEQAAAEPAARAAARPALERDAAEAASPARRPLPDSLWSQEPVLAAMRQELNSMRGMLEHQLSGLAWGELVRTRPQRAGILRRLVALGISPRLARQLAEQVGEHGERSEAWRAALGRLARTLPVCGQDLLDSGGIIALLGPTGVGKTTMAAKLAARFCLRHGPRQVALVTTDNFRVAAHEQLRTYARILDITLRVVEEGEEIGSVLDGLADRHLVLIDTAGIGQRDRRLARHLSLLRAEHWPIRRYLVLSATTHAAGLAQTVRAFRKVPLAGCMITKIDEAVSLGGVLSVAIEEQLPIACAGNGQRVPEDLVPARPHNLVSEAVALSRLTGAGKRVSDEAVALSFGRMAANGEL